MYIYRQIHSMPSLVYFDVYLIYRQIHSMPSLVYFDVYLQTDTQYALLSLLLNLADSPTHAVYKEKPRILKIPGTVYW